MDSPAPASSTQFQRWNACDNHAAIAYDLPYDVLYFRTNVEAVSDRFYGWISEKGTVFNEKSIFNIRPRTEDRLNAQFVDLQNTMKSNSTVEIEVLVNIKVKNAYGSITRVPAGNVRVELNASRGTLADEVGFTDINGKFETTLTAPYVPPTDDFRNNGSNILLEIERAVLEDYDDEAGGVVSLITVFPEGVDFLVPMISIEPDVIEDVDSSGNPGIAQIVVSVTNQNNIPVNGTSLAWVVDLDGPSISPSTATTDSNGKASFTFTAIDIDADSSYKLNIIAAKSGYKNGSQIGEIRVLNYIPPTGTLEVESFDYAPIAIAVVVVASIPIVTYTIIRTKKP